MAITILDSTTAVVEDYTDLNAVLSDTGGIYADINYIYLNRDIIMGGGIQLSSSRAAVTVDGYYPAGTGLTATITDYDSNDNNRTFYVSGNSGMQVTFKNLNWSGENYYGMLYYNSNGSDILTFTIDHVNYSGPQMCFTNYAKTVVLDSNIIVQTGWNGQSPQEIGQITDISIGGTCYFSHVDENSGDSCFWFTGTNAALTILADAEVTLDTVMDVIYEDREPAFTIEENASLTLNTQKGVCRSSGHAFSSVTIADNAGLYINQTASISVPILNCSGAFSVGNGGVLSIVNTGGGGSAALALAGGDFILNNPALVRLYNSGGNVFAFSGTSALSLTAGQFNRWTTAATPYSSAGGTDDVPDQSLHLEDYGQGTISGSAASGDTGVTGDGYDPTALSAFKLQNIQVFAAGSLPLKVEPVTTDGYPVSGATKAGITVTVNYTMDGNPYELTGTSGENGAFAIATESDLVSEAEVTVTVSTPFLLAALSETAVEPGELLISDVPAQITFELVSVNDDPILYGRTDPDVSVRISDTRVRTSGWELTCTIDGDLTCYSADGSVKGTLPGALVFVDTDDVIHTLGSTPVTVWSSPDGGSAEIIWEVSRGLLMGRTDQAFYAGHLYTADINWSLSEAGSQNEEP